MTRPNLTNIITGIAVALLSAGTTIGLLSHLEKPTEEITEPKEVHRETEKKEPASRGRNLGTFRISRYHMSAEGFYNRWYDFYRDVRMEGHGITRDGLLCNYLNIRPTREASRCKPNPNSSRGTTSIGEEPNVGRTIAVDFGVIKKGSAVRLRFVNENGRQCTTQQCNEWNGWYLAGDTGGAFNGGVRAIDLYDGLGTDNAFDGNRYSTAEGLPYSAQVYVVPPTTRRKRRLIDNREFIDDLLRRGHPRILATSARHEEELVARFNDRNPRREIRYGQADTRNPLRLIASYLP